MLTIKIKSFFLKLYPELHRLKIFQNLNLHPWVLNPKVQRVLRFGLPILLVLFILVLSLALGSFLISMFQPRQVTPPVIESPTVTPQAVYESPFLSTKKMIESFNPQLPDPLPPIFDEKISLEKLDQ